MDTYTISFFGHREIDHPVEVRQRLEDIIKDLLLKKEYIEFLIGRDGEFDILTASIIRQAIRDYGNGNAAMILVLPYMKADYRDNEQSYLAYYHEIEICSASAEAHPKSAIQIRNRNMIDRSNLVVCCIQHKSGGAYKTIQYAMKRIQSMLAGFPCNPYLCTFSSNIVIITGAVHPAPFLLSKNSKGLSIAALC